MTHRREFTHALQEQRRRAPSRTRSADGGNGRSGRMKNAPRSRTEDSINRGIHSKMNRHTRSLPSGGLRLPNRNTNQFMVNGRPQNVHVRNGPHPHVTHHSTTGRPGTATLSSRAGHRRALASEATQRAMQWNPPKPGVHEIHNAPPPPPPPPKPLHNDEDSLYKPADTKLAKQYEDRAYEFYERQKQLELKRELLDRAAKRGPGLAGPENTIRPGNVNFGSHSYGKAFFKILA